MGENMKPLPEEEKAYNILQRAKKAMPELKIPTEDQICFFNRAPNLLGLGGSLYGIGINVSHLDSAAFEETILHELVHFQGIHNHGKDFYDKLHELRTKYDSAAD